MPVYYPNTPRIADAGVVALTAERMTAHAEVAFQHIRSASITGTAIDSEGKPMALSEVIVFLAGPRSFPVARGEVKPDGTFAVLGLGPGDYRLEVRASVRNRDKLAEEARTAVSINGADVGDVWLVGRKAVSSKPAK